MNKSKKLKKIKKNKSKSKSFNKYTRKGGTNKTRRFRGGSKFKCNVTRKTSDNFEIDCNPLKVTFDLAAEAEAKKAEAEAKATTKIQAIARRRGATKKVATKKVATKKAEAEATTKIQAIARRREATKKVKTKKAEAEATTKIQAIARRRGATKKVATKKAELVNAISEAEKTLDNALRPGLFKKYFRSNKSKIEELKKVLSKTKKNNKTIKSGKIDELMKEINTLINADDVKKAEAAAKSLNSQLKSELEINDLDENEKKFYDAALEYHDIELQLKKARAVEKPHTENHKKLIKDLLTEKEKKQREKLSLRKNVNMNKREKVSNLIKKYIKNKKEPIGGKRTRHNKKYTKKTRKHRKDN